MRLQSARVKNYRSIIDTGWFDIENDKTILVGPNEAGKTVLLQALQHLNAPEDTRPLDPLRDYPRAQYQKINRGLVKVEEVPVVEAKFTLDNDDVSELGEDFSQATYCCERYLDGGYSHRLEKGPAVITLKDVGADLKRLALHANKLNASTGDQEAGTQRSPSESLNSITAGWKSRDEVLGDRSEKLIDWLDSVFQFVDEGNEKEQARWDKLKEDIESAQYQEQTLESLRERVPIFVLFNNYFRVRPVIHLSQLAARIANGTLDDSRFDYGNVCLLKLLGIDATELSEMGVAPDLDDDDPSDRGVSARS